MRIVLPGSLPADFVARCRVGMRGSGNAGDKFRAAFAKYIWYHRQGQQFCPSIVFLQVLLMMSKNFSTFSRKHVS